MFTELLPNIGTKNYKYDDFNNRLLSCTNGIDVKIDKFCDKDGDIFNSNENLILSIGFLD